MGMGVLTRKPDDSYLHGGNPAGALAGFGLAETQVLDFSVNLNPLGVPSVVRECWEGLADAVEDYPSIEGKGIVGYYRNKFNLSPENVLAGNGSTELIYLIPRAFRFQRVLLMAPSFHDYERASVLAGALVKRFQVPDQKCPGEADEALLVEAVKDVDAVWLGRPNNPTGELLPKSLVMRLSERFPDKWFLLDEAFIQFVDNWETESFMFEPRPENVIVIHSLTKFYALAGLRMGGVVAAKKVVSKLGAVKEPWSVNGIADRVAPYLLDCPDYEEESRLFVREERKRLYHILKSMDGIRPFVPSANFICCQWTKTGDLNDLMKHLLVNGVYVRDCRNFPGLPENCFRIGLRRPDENDRLISIVDAYHPDLAKT